MTADSELFVTETVREEIHDELNDLFPGIESDFSVKVPSEWRDIWDASQYPDEGEAEIIYKVPHPTEASKELDGEVFEYLKSGAEKEVPIATVKWDTDFFIESGMGGRWIEATAEITEVEPKLDREKWFALKLNEKKKS